MAANGTYDVIVVGAGSVGNPSACFLAQAGLKVLALDRRPAAGQGDNKAAIGGVRATHSDPGKIMTCSESLKIFTTWEETYGFGMGWKPGGYCFPVFDAQIEGVLKGILPLQKAHGLEIDWVDADRIAELCPGITRDGLRGGTYSPNDGQVSPLLAPVAFQREAQRHGAEYRFNERVLGYLREGDRVTGVRTDRGEYHAGETLLAAGADASEHGGMLGFEIPVAPDAHEAGISAPVAHFLAPLVVDLRPGPEGRTANFYFGQNHEGQIIFCYTPKQLFPGTDRESLSEFLPILANRMISLIPRLRNLLIRRVWRGCYPMTPDGVPIIDRIEGVDGLLLAVGMCGQGFMMGPGVAKNVTSLILGGRSTLPDEVHACFRFKRDYWAAKKEALK
ncbi:FAD-binding oxidoreductase [bacterium]|nr:FAD-binding oxidoreductase [bacterium]MBU1674307.1 FAD-binding oxidoreductase [bacterium]